MSSNKDMRALPFHDISYSARSIPYVCLEHCTLLVRIACIDIGNEYQSSVLYSKVSWHGELESSELIPLRPRNTARRSASALWALPTISWCQAPCPTPPTPSDLTPNFSA